MEASLDERWVETTPQALRDRSLESFAARLPLILADLGALERRGRPVLAEGFCLIPDLVAPLINDPRRAIWLLPTEAFKRRSWERRGKPSFKDKLSDPERGARNLFERDMLLGEEIARQTAARGFATLTIDGEMSEADLAALVADRFRPFLDSEDAALASPRLPLLSAIDAMGDGAWRSSFRLRPWKTAPASMVKSSCVTSPSI
jgi:hypothetical protein